MSKTGSYIKIDRGLKSNSIWLEKPFSKGQAWVDLLILTQGIDRETVVRGKVQQQKRGNVYTSIVFLADRWGWSRNKVYRFLGELVNARMVVIQGWTGNGTPNGTSNGTHNGTVITIENWDVYQYSETADGTQNRTLPSSETEHTIERQYKEKRERNKRSTQKNENGPVRGSALWKAKSHILLQRDEGTLDDIPDEIRGDYKSFQEYWDWRNQ